VTAKAGVEETRDEQRWFAAVVTLCKEMGPVGRSRPQVAEDPSEFEDKGMCSWQDQSLEIFHERTPPAF